MRSAAVFLLISLWLPGTAAGQSARPPDHPVLKKLIALFQKPSHPIVKTVAPGGGIGGGWGYRPKNFWDTRGFASANGVFTVNRYWSTEINAGFREGRYNVETYGRARDMKRLDFYGLGSESSPAYRADFRLLDRAVGGMGSVRFGGVAVGGRVESLWPGIRSGESNDVPSIEQRYTESTLPGLASQPRFSHYQVMVNANYPFDLNARGFIGGDYRVAYDAFKDGDGGLYSFRRLSAEAQQRIPGFREDQRLTLHGLVSTSTSATDKRVPFYLQATLGGAGSVRGFNDEIIGTDGSKATLRGFRDLRFRGPHLILLQAEYRFLIWGPIDGTVFGDAGQTTTARNALNVDDLKHDYGFSVSFMTGNATALRLEVGTGGREGTHVFLTIGPIWAQ